MRAPELAVLDLTSRIGGYALAHLGVAGASGHGAWEQLPLGDMAGAPQLSWYRPAAVADLNKLPGKPDALAILVGPGVFTMLPAVLAHDTVRAAPAVWFILLPNAVMEDIEISKFLRTHGRAGVHKYQLPNSDPQTLWFVLMEQLGKVDQVNGYFNEDRRSDDMSSNLKSSMDAAMTIDGAQAVALVDYRSGMCLARPGAA